MLALLSILFALALLGLTVYALHRYQTMEVEYSVDRSAPLPPLNEEKPVNPPLTDTQQAPVVVPVKKSPPARPAVKKQPRKTSTKLWQDEVTALKNAGHYAEAAAVCQKQLPLWGAFNQLCMLIRSELKESKLPPEQRESLLSRLFHTAAIAEFLHDKSGDSEKLSNSQLRKLNLEDIRALKFPYNDIGYAHLRLIRKSDIKFMVETWGRPDGHTTPRKYHAQWWQKQVKS